jgi:hypothetical protein
MIERDTNLVRSPPSWKPGFALILSYLGALTGAGIAVYLTPIEQGGYYGALGVAMEKLTLSALLGGLLGAFPGIAWYLALRVSE